MTRVFISYSRNLDSDYPLESLWRSPIYIFRDIDCKSDICLEIENWLADASAVLFLSNDWVAAMARKTINHVGDFVIPGAPNSAPRADQSNKLERRILRPLAEFWPPLASGMEQSQPRVDEKPLSHWTALASLIAVLRNIASTSTSSALSLADTPSGEAIQLLPPSKSAKNHGRESDAGAASATSARGAFARAIAWHLRNTASGGAGAHTVDDKFMTYSKEKIYDYEHESASNRLSRLTDRMRSLNWLADGNATDTDTGSGVTEDHATLNSFIQQDSRRERVAVVHWPFPDGGRQSRKFNRWRLRDDRVDRDADTVGGRATAVDGFKRDSDSYMIEWNSQMGCAAVLNNRTICLDFGIMNSLLSYDELRSQMPSSKRKLYNIPFASGASRRWPRPRRILMPEGSITRVFANGPAGPIAGPPFQSAMDIAGSLLIPPRDISLLYDQGILSVLKKNRSLS